MGFIYMLTSPSGKQYIGQTIRPVEDRWYQHGKRAFYNSSNGCIALNCAIRKYGFENFKKEVLMECENEDLDDMETLSIIECKTLHPFGYNLKQGGETAKYSEDSRKKMSATQKTLYQTSEKMREQIKMNGFYHKKNKSLPMYFLEEYNKKGDVRGYRVFCHPVNPKSRSFSKSIYGDKAYEVAMTYLSELNKHLQDKEKVQRLDGNGSFKSDFERLKV
jgi:hypothetical protein